RVFRLWHPNRKESTRETFASQRLSHRLWASSLRSPGVCAQRGLKLRQERRRAKGRSVSFFFRPPAACKGMSDRRDIILEEGWVIGSGTGTSVQPDRFGRFSSATSAKASASSAVEDHPPQRTERKDAEVR